MRVLWVFAHPEQRSLSGALRDAGVRWLEDAGHQVMVSDLYAMGWNPIVSGEDFAHDAGERLMVGDASALAYGSGRLSADIVEEQRKIAWADTLVFQFPLWWYGMPAMLKGWFDRIFVKGFAFGVNDPGTGQTLRYGQGKLSGKTAMVVTSVGARESSIGPGESTARSTSCCSRYSTARSGTPASPWCPHWWFTAPTGPLRRTMNWLPSGSADV